MVDMTGLREIQPEKGSMGVHFLNANQAHLWEAEQEQGCSDHKGQPELAGYLLR
jgi:hypothetical protein